MIDLRDCRSLKQLGETLQSGSLSSTNPWIVGFGWDEDTLGSTLDRHILDTVFKSSRPVVFFRNCLHLCVVNTAALVELGLLGKVPETDHIPLKSLRELLQVELKESLTEAERGHVRLDSENIPSGVLCETILFKIKHFLFSLYTPSQLHAIYKAGLYQVMKRGVTCVQTNDFFSAWQQYHILQRSGDMPIRVMLTVPWDEISIVDQDLVEEAGIPMPNDEQGLLSCHRVKLFVDGSLGAKTAALRNPYHNCTHGHCHGVLLQTQQELDVRIAEAHGRGYRLEIHVIGDKAAESALDSLQRAGISEADRPILTHCQVLGADLIQRMQSIGVIANIQPSFVTTDAQTIPTVLGDQDDQRFKYLYAWKTLLDAGVHCAGGSDAPVEDPNPFWGMHAAIYRTFNDKINFVFRPEERLSWNQALALYTIDGAYCAGEEDRLGQLKVGYQADFVVVDSDKLHLSGVETKDEQEKFQRWKELCNVQALEVWVAGTRRYKKH